MRVFTRYLFLYIEKASVSLSLSAWTCFFFEAGEHDEESTDGEGVRELGATILVSLLFGVGRRFCFDLLWLFLYCSGCTLQSVCCRR